MDALAKAIEGFIELASGPNSGPIIFGMVIALFALLVSYIFLWLQFHARLSDKDRHIEDLVNERNKLQDYILRNKGLTRKSSNDHQ